jgi:hypothetical protein
MSDQRTCDGCGRNLATVPTKHILRIRAKTHSNCEMCEKSTADLVIDSPKHPSLASNTDTIEETVISPSIDLCSPYCVGVWSAKLANAVADMVWRGRQPLAPIPDVPPASHRKQLEVPQ